MDPEAAWRALILALIEDDSVAADEHAKNLIQWLQRGGFPPQVLPEFEQSGRNEQLRLGQLNKMIVTFVCASVRTIF